MPLTFDASMWFVLCNVTISHSEKALTEQLAVCCLLLTSFGPTQVLIRHTGTDKSISSLQSTGRRDEGFYDTAGWFRLYLYSGLKTKIRVSFYYPGKSGKPNKIC